MVQFMSLSTVFCVLVDVPHSKCITVTIHTRHGKEGS